MDLFLGELEWKASGSEWTQNDLVQVPVKIYQLSLILLVLLEESSNPIAVVTARTVSSSI